MNGSDFFSVDSGIRQGDPFPPLAFVLAMELLAMKIRDVQNIKYRSDIKKKLKKKLKTKT